MSAVTCRFSVPSKIVNCCDQESTRYALGSVLVSPADADHVYLTATDSRCLAVVRTEGTATGDHLVPAKCFPKLTKGVSCAVEVNGAIRAITQPSRKPGSYCDHPLPVETPRFPRLESVMPSVSMETHIAVRLNVDFLRNLADAIATDAGMSQTAPLTLFIPRDVDTTGDNPGQVVDAVGVLGGRGVGVIMPINYDNAFGEYTEQRDAYVSARQATLAAAAAK